jgi:hypothetical protein
MLWRQGINIAYDYIQGGVGEVKTRKGVESQGMRGEVDAETTVNSRVSDDFMPAFPPLRGGGSQEVKSDFLSMSKSVCLLPKLPRKVSSEITGVLGVSLANFS